MSEVDLSSLPDSVGTVFGDIPLIVKQSLEVEEAMKKETIRKATERKRQAENGEEIVFTKSPIVLQEKGPVFIEPQEATTVSAESVVPYCTPNDKQYIKDRRIDTGKMTIKYPSLATPPKDPHIVAVIDREGIRAMQKGYTELKQYFGPKGEIDSPDVLIDAKARDPDKQLTHETRIWQRDANVVDETNNFVAAFEYMIIVPPENSDALSPIVILLALIKVDDRHKGGGARQIIHGAMAADATELGEKLGMGNREIVLLAEVEPLSEYGGSRSNSTNTQADVAKPDEDRPRRLKAFQNSGGSMVQVEANGEPVPYYAQPELRPRKEWTNGIPKPIDLNLILWRYDTKKQEYITNNSIPKSELLSSVRALREVYRRCVEPEALEQCNDMLAHLEDMLKDVEDVPLSYDFATPKG